jgi:DNA-binding transcriptional LysR family regulator
MSSSVTTMSYVAGVRPQYRGSVTLDDLRVFIAVCETENLSAVARATSRTQSAVSQHVKRLERELGVALVERHPRGVVPTEAGRILCEAARRGTTELDGAVRRLDELRRGAGGTVRVTTGGVTVRHFMPAAVAAFRRRHPRVRLEFQSANSTRRCAEALHGGHADLAWIIMGQSLHGIEQRAVIDLPWVLVVHADDPLAGRAVIEPGDLATIRYIAQPENSASRIRLEEQLGRLGVLPPPPVSVADWDTAIVLAELDVGHALLPTLPRLDLTPDSPVRAIPVTGLGPITVGWAARQWRSLSPLAAEFAETVAGSLDGLGSRPPGQTESSIRIV